ncbi:MAG: hypothetical protein RL215_2547 [Planctomycetota bacterium]
MAAIDAVFPAAGFLEGFLSGVGELQCGERVSQLIFDQGGDAVGVIGWEEPAGIAVLQCIDTAVDGGGGGGESDGVGFEENVWKSFPGGG